MRKLLSDSDSRIVILIMLVALLVRMLILPWSQTVHADAVTRVFLAADWLANPHYISSGYWGPLHVYLNALFLWIFPDQINAPKLLNILFATISVPPLYFFTKRVFKNRLGAVFVVLTYVLSPIVLRNSFLALAEVMYAFFILLTMYFLEKGFSLKSVNRYAVLAGISITLAAATRYEAWVLIALFTLVSLLRSNWQFTGLFWAFSMLFPLSWMIGNYVAFGDFLYSVSQNDVWNLVKEGLNDKVDEVTLIERLVYFPFAYVLNVNPIGFSIGMAGLIWSVAKNQISKEQLVWLIPFAVIVVVFLQKAYEGTFMLQMRFVITWVILFLPFTALVFSRVSFQRLKIILMSFSVITLVPLSFFWGFLRPEKLFGKTDFGKSLENIVLREAKEFEAVPLLRDSITENMTAHLHTECEASDGLILDSFGWDKTYYVALRAGVRPSITDNSKNGDVDYSNLERYLEIHPKGFLVLSRFGKLNDEGNFKEGTICWPNSNTCLELSETLDFEGEKMFRYKAVNADQNSNKNAKAEAGVFPHLDQYESLEFRIRRDKVWLNKTRRSAFWSGESLDTEIKKTVIYTIELQKGSS